MNKLDVTAELNSTTLDDKELYWVEVRYSINNAEQRTVNLDVDRCIDGKYVLTCLRNYTYSEQGMPPQSDEEMEFHAEHSDEDYYSDLLELIQAQIEVVMLIEDNAGKLYMSDSSQTVVGLERVEHSTDFADDARKFSEWAFSDEWKDSVCERPDLNDWNNYKIIATYSRGDGEVFIFSERCGAAGKSYLNIA